MIARFRCTHVDLRTLLSHGGKFGGMNIRNPVEGADRLFEASEAALEVLVASLLNGAELELMTHRGQVRAVSVTARKEKMEREKAVVEGMKAGAPKKNHQAARANQAVWNMAFHRAAQIEWHNAII